MTTLGTRVPAVTVAAALSLVFGLTASAASTRSEEPTTIHLISIGSSSRTAETPPNGQLNKGDTVYERTMLRNGIRQFGRREGAIVGRDRAVYTFLSNRAVRVTLVTTLPGGTLRVRSRRVRLDSEFRSLPVVDGTGRYENARGTLDIVRLSGTTFFNVYRLRPDERRASS